MLSFNFFATLPDVLRILQALRDLGFSQGLTYKTDEATLAGEYSFNTAGPVSLYYAPKGAVELSTPKGKSPKKRTLPTQQLRRSQIQARRKPREISYDSERTEEWLQENDFYESGYFHDIMNRDD